MWTEDNEINDAMAFAFKCMKVDPYPIRVRWSARLRTSAGVAYPKACKSRWHNTPEIKLSTKLLARATPEQRRTTIIHETLHVLVERALYEARKATSGHGIVWQWAMEVCGLEPTPYHGLDLTGIAPGAYTTCACGVFYSRPKTVKRIRAGVRMICKRCRQEASIAGGKHENAPM
jgi:predicted SprT family Zn-dependent metalloprotease